MLIPKGFSAQFNLPLFIPFPRVCGRRFLHLHVLSPLTAAMPLQVQLLFESRRWTNEKYVVRLSLQVRVAEACFEREQTTGAATSSVDPRQHWRHLVINLCRPSTNSNKKQCSRQLQCEVPCSVGNVVNSSLFINSSLSSLSSTNHAVRGGPGGGGLATMGGGVWPWGGVPCVVISQTHRLVSQERLSPRAGPHSTQAIW